jgi:hypothetical protein
VPVTILGLAGLIWGASGLAQAGLFTMEQVWNLPGPARTRFPRPRTTSRFDCHRAGKYASPCS